MRCYLYLARGEGMIAVILAGGKGVRLWPESREARPKQLCNFFGDKSMLEHTIERLVVTGSDKVMVVTNQAQVGMIRSSLGKDYLKRVEIVGEPRGRNTAPALGLALARYWPEQSDEVVGIFPADHYVTDQLAFTAVVSQAVAAARENYLVTIGIQPEYPETGYGYIQKSDTVIAGIDGAFVVRAFKEKPDPKTARSYLESGGYLWNAGIFIGKVGLLVEEYSRYLPEIYQYIESGYEKYLANYENLPEISIDYGIAEKSSRVAVVEGDFGWSDVGSWKALAELLPGDERGNVLLGDVVAMDATGCMVRQSQKTVVLLGVEDLVVVETGDTVLVCHQDHSQDIRKVVDYLQEQGRSELL